MRVDLDPAFRGGLRCDAGRLRSQGHRRTLDVDREVDGNRQTSVQMDGDSIRFAHMQNARWLDIGNHAPTDQANGVCGDRGQHDDQPHRAERPPSRGRERDA